MRKYSNNRSGRIADQIHKDIVTILKHKVKDPRVTWVIIYEVEVDKNYAFAKIYWNILDNKFAVADVNKALESAKGYIRSELSKGFKTYTIPQLKFVLDDSIERGSKILNLINKANETIEEGF
jgi:ribosome-binding factor A